MSPLLARGLFALALLVAASLAAWLFSYADLAGFHSDELNVLHHVGKFAEGDVRRPGRPGLLWLALTPLMSLGSPAAILEGARLVSAAAAACSVALLLHLGTPGTGPRSNSAIQSPAGRSGRNFWRLLAPIFALLMLGSAGLWVTHSVELRTDSFTTPLTLGVLVLLWGRHGSIRRLLAAAVLVAAAGLCSQKSLYNAAGLGLAWLVALPSSPLGSTNWRWRIRHAAIGLGLCAALVVLWYVGLSLVGGSEANVVSSNLKTATRTAFGGDISWDEKTAWLTEAVQRSPLLYLGALAGVPAMLLRRSEDGRPLASFCVAAVMLGVIFVHRGFFPYYISSVEPFLALPAAWGLLSLPWGLVSVATRISESQLMIVSAKLLGLCAAVALMATSYLGPARSPWLDDLSGTSVLDWGAASGVEQASLVTNEAQLALAQNMELAAGPAGEEGVRDADGQVRYLAGIAVAPGYKEVTGYLTGVTRQRRRRTDPNFIATALRDNEVPLFVRTYMSRDRYLRPKERSVLYGNYLPVRPSIYLHGSRSRWSAGTGRATRAFDVFITGDYRLLLRSGGTPAFVEVDGKPIENGESVSLQAGRHSLSIGSAEQGGELWLLLDTGVEPEPPGQHVDLSVFPKDRKASRSRYQRYDSRKQGFDLLSPPGTTRHKQRIARHRRTLKAREKKLWKTVALEWESTPLD